MIKHTTAWSPVRIYQDSNGNRYRATIWEMGGHHSLSCNLPDDTDIANLTLAAAAPLLLDALNEARAFLATMHPLGEDTQAMHDRTVEIVIHALREAGKVTP